MNVKEFYKKQKKEEEEAFFHNTGLRIRHSFQNYNKGGDNVEIFFLRTTSQQKCLGIEFNRCIFYILPRSYEQSLLLIFDDSFKSLVEVFSNWSEPRFKVFCKHVASFKLAIDNANQNDFVEVGLLLDENMLCFAKQIDYPLEQKIRDGEIIDSYLISEVTKIILFRNQCEKEIVSFEGFTSKDETEITIKESLSTFKRGMKMMRIMDMFSTND